MPKKGDNIKIVQEINRGKFDLIIHSAFLVGFLASSERRSLTHPDNLKEIKRLQGLINLN